MLPQMNEKFARFIEPAKEHPNGLLFLGSFCFLFLVFAQLSIVLFALLFIVFSIILPPEQMPHFDSFTASLLEPDTPLIMIALLTTFIAMFLAPWITVKLFRDQALKKLFGPGPCVANFFKALCFLFPVLAISTGLSFAAGTPVSNLPLGTWALWMLPALPLLLIQVTAEELLFRGYLLQEMASRFQSRWVWWFLPSLLFGFMHFEPNKFGDLAWLIVIVTTLFGLIAADVTVRTGNLGAAIGLHFTNNFFAMMILPLDGTLTGLGLYHTKAHVTDTDLLWPMLFVNIGMLLVVYLIYLLVIRFLARR